MDDLFPTEPPKPRGLVATNSSEYQMLLQLVRDVRRAQKRYFDRGRNREDLIEAKRLEKQLDDLIFT